jgi:hypothetical protein
MTEIPVMAGIALTIAYFCLPLFRIFKAHCGSNIQKRRCAQKYHRDQNISGVFFAMAKEANADVAFFTLKMAEPSFPLDVFRRIFFVLSIHAMDR